MNRRIFYTDGDGYSHLVVPAPSFRNEGETDGEFIARVAEKDVPKDATAMLIADLDELPEDMEAPAFFAAWIVAGERIAVNMPKAREIWRDRIREARKPMLEALDIEYHRADERGDSAGKMDVTARKQALRDAPAHPDIEAAATIEALKEIWPLPAGTSP